MAECRGRPEEAVEAPNALGRISCAREALLQPGLWRWVSYSYPVSKPECKALNLQSDPKSTSCFFLDYAEVLDNCSKPSVLEYPPSLMVCPTLFFLQLQCSYPKDCSRNKLVSSCTMRFINDIAGTCDMLWY